MIILSSIIALFLSNSLPNDPICIDRVPYTGGRVLSGRIINTYPKIPVQFQNFRDKDGSDFKSCYVKNKKEI